MTLHQVLSFITYVIGLINIIALVSMSITMLSGIKLISNEPFWVFILVAFNPPITYLLVWCFLVSSVIMTIIFNGLISVNWPQLKDLFGLNTAYILYNLIHFYIVGFIIPKM